MICLPITHPQGAWQRSSPVGFCSSWSWWPSSTMAPLCTTAIWSACCTGQKHAAWGSRRCCRQARLDKVQVQQSADRLAWTMWCNKVPQSSMLLSWTQSKPTEIESQVHATVCEGLLVECVQHRCAHRRCKSEHTSMVDRRCATTMVVRPTTMRSSAACTTRSEAVSVQGAATAGFIVCGAGTCASATSFCDKRQQVRQATTGV